MNVGALVSVAEGRTLLIKIDNGTELEPLRISIKRTSGWKKKKKRSGKWDNNKTMKKKIGSR